MARDPMVSDLRPLGIGSKGQDKLYKSTYQLTVKGGTTYRGVHVGSVTIQGTMDPGFQRLLRDRGRFTRAFGDVNRTHASMAFGAVSRVARNLNEKVKQNPRPNREDREGLRMTLRTRYEELYDVNYANRAGAGFVVDFNRLDTIGPFDDQGRPYWRFVDSGFAPRTVNALFFGPDGWSPPRVSRIQVDPRMPQLNTIAGGGRVPGGGVTFEMRGFKGYNFVGPTLTEYGADLRKTAFMTYLADLQWPDEVREAAILFMSGGSDAGGLDPDYRQF